MYSMINLFNGLVIFGLCSMSLLLSGQEKESADRSALVGGWAWTTKQSDGALFTSVMDIDMTKTGSLMGSIRNPKGDNIPFQEVTLASNQVDVRLDYNIFDQTFKAVYSGKLSGDIIDGNVEIQFQDRTIRRGWKAQRLKEFPLTGEWDWKLSMPDGNELKATLFLDQDARGVSGRLVSDQFNMPLSEVSFEKGQLKFVTQREEDGGTFYSSGTWHGNRIAGEVSSPSIGDELRLPWEARKRP